MINTLIRWAVYSILIILTAWIIPGINIENFLSAMLACVIIALINAFIKPVLMFISLPVNFITLGLFTLVINAFLLMLAGKITPGFEVNGFLSAFFGSIVLSFLAGAVNKIR